MSRPTEREVADHLLDSGRKLLAAFKVLEPEDALGQEVHARVMDRFTAIFDQAQRHLEDT